MSHGNAATLPLTPKQQRTFDLIVAHQKRHGCTPTLRELQKAMGAKAINSVVDHLNRLEVKGKIRRSNELYRNIEIVGSPTLPVRYQRLLEGLRAELARLKALDPDVLSEMVKVEKAAGEAATTSFVRLRDLLREVE